VERRRQRQMCIRDSAKAMMRSRVSGRIDSLPFKARDTVAVETPANLAMSNI
jgi:hypothetical protein